MSEPRTITAWVCDECGYWRQEKSTGVHQTSNPEDPRGHMIRHQLRVAFFVEAAGSTEEKGETDDVEVVQIPAHIQAGVQLIKSKGLCGEVSPDGQWVCILDAGHAERHRWRVAGSTPEEET